MKERTDKCLYVYAHGEIPLAANLNLLATAGRSAVIDCKVDRCRRSPYSADQESQRPTEGQAPYGI
jgi:hypothetical protein